MFKKSNTDPNNIKKQKRKSLSLDVISKSFIVPTNNIKIIANNNFNCYFIIIYNKNITKLNNDIVELNIIEPLKLIVKYYEHYKLTYNNCLQINCNTNIVIKNNSLQIIYNNQKLLNELLTNEIFIKLYINNNTLFNETNKQVLSVLLFNNNAIKLSKFCIDNLINDKTDNSIIFRETNNYIIILINILKIFCKDYFDYIYKSFYKTRTKNSINICEKFVKKLFKYNNFPYVLTEMFKYIYDKCLIYNLNYYKLFGSLLFLNYVLPNVINNTIEEHHRTAFRILNKLVMLNNFTKDDCSYNVFINCYTQNIKDYYDRILNNNTNNDCYMFNVNNNHYDSINKCFTDNANNIKFLLNNNEILFTFMKYIDPTYIIPTLKYKNI